MCCLFCTVQQRKNSCCYIFTRCKNLQSHQESWRSACPLRCVSLKTMRMGSCVLGNRLKTFWMAVVGLYRTGKSYLMNRLAGQQSGERNC